MKELEIRRAQLSDLEELQSLFVETIRKTCSRDYSPEQITAWTSSIKNLDRWKRLILQQYSIVAIIDTKIVGMAALDEADYLDFLYVHFEFQRQGIAKALFDEMKLESLRQGFYKLTSDVSITARPFFDAQGFQIVKENRNQINGVELINFRMKES